VAASYSFGSVPQLYVNGNLQTISYGGRFPVSISPTLYISEYNIGGGGRTFDGIIDQVQHAPAAKSANWIAREYNNQSTFSTNGVFAFELRRKKSIFIPVLINLVKRANV
ncbi:MAG TPA: hypothetical protein VKP88_04770, partial [Candidatus Paceibacterota bacterium]|nr:hypothetical protein [Candidatus Paceibacterota bacterium]